MPKMGLIELSSRELRQRPSGQSQEGDPRPCCPGDARGGVTARPLQGLGRDDPQGLRGGPDDLCPLRREDEGHGLSDRVCGRRPDHPSPGVDVRRGETAAGLCLRTAGPDGGRRERGVRMKASGRGERSHAERNKEIPIKVTLRVCESARPRGA